MARRGKSKTKKLRREQLREQIAMYVASAFPGCEAVFVGQQSRAALNGRTFGYRVRDANGKFRSNIIWIE